MSEGQFIPKMYFLWEGVPFEELGIHESVVSAEFVTTVDRGKPSKRFVMGKPKVGAARIVFETTSIEITGRLVELTRVHARPEISVAEGYEDGQIIWVGSFKMDKTKWDYPATSITKLTLVGQTSKALGLTQKMKPRVYTSSNIKRIIEGIANEHGIVLDIDPELDLTKNLDSVMKSNQESDWQFITRLLDAAGAAGVWLTSSVSKTKFAFNKIRTVNEIWNQKIVSIDGSSQLLQNLKTNERHILVIRRMPAWLNHAKFELARPVRLGYGGRRTHADDIDQLIVSASITEEGKYTAAVATRTVQTTTNAFASTKLETAPFLDTGLKQKITSVADVVNALDGGSAPRNPGALSRHTRSALRDKDDVPGISIYVIHGSSLPFEMDGGTYNSAFLFAVSLQHGYTHKITLEINPAIPQVQAPSMVTLSGTDAHDGTWGVVESRVKYDASKGLTQTLTCKPISTGKPAPVHAKGASTSFADVGVETAPFKSIGLTNEITTVRGVVDLLETASSLGTKRVYQQDDPVE